MAIDSSIAEVYPNMPPNTGMSSVSDMPLSPGSAASSGHFPFSASEVSRIGVDTAFMSDVVSSAGLQLSPDNGTGNSKDYLGSFGQIPWNFSLLDLTVDLSNLGGNLVTHLVLLYESSGIHTINYEYSRNVFR